MHQLPNKLPERLWEHSFIEVGSGALVFATTAQDISTLRPGDWVTVSGRIIRINFGSVSLEEAIVCDDRVSFP